MDFHISLLVFAHQRLHQIVRIFWLFQLRTLRVEVENVKLGVRPDQVAVILLNEPWFLLFYAHVGPLAGTQVLDEKLRALPSWLL